MDQVMDLPGFDQDNAKSPSQAARTLDDAPSSDPLGQRLSKMLVAANPTVSGAGPRPNRNQLRRSSEIAKLELIPNPKTTGQLELAQRVRHARVHEGSLGHVQSLAAQFASFAVGHVVSEFGSIRQMRLDSEDPWATPADKQNAIKTLEELGNPQTDAEGVLEQRQGELDSTVFALSHHQEWVTVASLLRQSELKVAEAQTAITEAELMFELASECFTRQSSNWTVKRGMINMKRTGARANPLLNAVGHSSLTPKGPRRTTNKGRGTKVSKRPKPEVDEDTPSAPPTSTPFPTGTKAAPHRYTVAAPGSDGPGGLPMKKLGKRASAPAGASRVSFPV